VTIEFSFLYQFDKDLLANVYNAYGSSYVQPLLRSARSAILAEAGNWNTTAYWNNRFVFCFVFVFLFVFVLLFIYDCFFLFYYYLFYDYLFYFILLELMLLRHSRKHCKQP